jgi:hypothetical protein
MFGTGQGLTFDRSRCKSILETFGKRPFLPNFCVPAERDLRFAPAAQILILEILQVFLWLKSSSSLNLNKTEHFPKFSL